MGEMSRAAVRVYTYLRTWCIGDIGRASQWRKIAVRKIAQDLSWSSRYVRKGLAELQRMGLLESRSTVEQLANGSWSTDANEWRILPEPGLSETAEQGEAPPPPPAERERRRAPPPKDAPELEDETDEQIRAAVAVVVDATPSWAADAAQQAADMATDYEWQAEQLDSDPDTYAPVWSPEECRSNADRLRREAEVTRIRQRTLEQQARAIAPAIASSPDWYPGVLRTVIEHVVRALISTGTRERTARREVTPSRVGKMLDSYLRSRGFDPPVSTAAA